MKHCQRLNLAWTVGDHDRAKFMLANRHLTLEEIAAKLNGTVYACTARRLREIAQAFRIKVKASAYEASA